MDGAGLTDRQAPGPSSVGGVVAGVTGLDEVRYACQVCGSHVTALVAMATVGGSCGNCGSYELAPLSDSTHASSRAEAVSPSPPLSRESAIVLGLASTVLPYSYAKEDQAEVWVRLLRCEGQVGEALRALGVREAPLGVPKASPRERSAWREDSLRLVKERTTELAHLQGQPTVGTGEVLFAVLELYRGAFTRSLYTHGVTLDQLLARLAHGSGPVARVPLSPAVL